MRQQLTTLIIIGVILTSLSCQGRKSPVIVETNIIPVIPTDKSLNNEMSQWIAPYKATLNEVMNVPIGIATNNLRAELPESLLGTMVTDAMSHHANMKGKRYDCIVYNVKGIRDSITKGDITIGDIYRVSPFENKMVLLTLSAKSIDSLCQIIASQGGQVTSGIKMEIRDGKGYHIRVNRRPIVGGKTYKVLTNDYLSFGNDYLFPLADYTDIFTFEGTIRDIIIDYIRFNTNNKRIINPRLRGEVYITR